MDRKQGAGFMKEIFGKTRFLVITGNYGSGKTEISLNLALKASAEGKTTLVDLDIVNPYFRSGEKAIEMEKAGIRVLMPTYALPYGEVPRHFSTYIHQRDRPGLIPAGTVANCQNTLRKMGRQLS